MPPWMATPNGRLTGSGAGMGPRGYFAFLPGGCLAGWINPRVGNELARCRRPGPAAARSMERRRTMKDRKNWSQIAGLVLHILIGGLLIFTGSQKVLGSVPPEPLVKYGLGEQARLIGAGAIL